MNFYTIGRKISKNKYLSNIYSIPNKNKTRFIFIFIFLIPISKIISPATILLKTKGRGNIQILNIDEGCFNTIPSQIIVNDVLQDYTGIYVYNLEQEINYITLKWNNDNEISSTHKMFYQLTNIIEIIIIDFSMSNFVDSRNMFEGCRFLEALAFYSIDTSKVTDMSRMFDGCCTLVSLNLNTFDVSQVISFFEIFNSCINLKSLNLNSFVLKPNADISSLFGSGHNRNLKLCYDISKASRFSSVYNSIENKCNEICYNGNIFICYGDDMSCPSGYTHLIPESKSCVKNCHDDKIFKFEYNNRCNEQCPRKTKDNNFICEDLNCNYYNLEQNECIDGISEGYYLKDSTERIVDKCSTNCKTCIDTNIKCTSCYDYYFKNSINDKCEKCSQNCLNCENYHICNQCIDGHQIINDNSNNKYCYPICPNFYYFDENGEYKCTDTNKCPDNFNKLIENEHKCIDQCSNDNIYHLEYENKCLSECPEYTYNDNGICELDLNEILKNKDNDDRMKSTQNYLKQVNPNKLKEKLKNRENFIFGFDKMNIIITNLEDEFEIKNNSLSYIDLNKCEYILKDIYNISNNESLILFKTEILKDQMNIPRIEYELYYALNKSHLNKLDLKICEGKNIYIYYLTDINEENIDKHNIKSNYYKDICYKSALNNADMTIEDKKNYYLDNNLNICEENCDFYNYEKIEGKVKCSCIIKTEIRYFSEVNINKYELIKGFKNINNIMNLNVIKCYKNVFTISGILKNYVFYFLVFILIFHLILFIIFIIKGKTKLKKFISLSLSNKWKKKEIIKKSDSKIKHIKRNFIKKKNIINPNKNTIIYKRKNIKKNSTNINKKYNNKNNLLTCKFSMKKTKNINKRTIYITINELNEIPYDIAMKFDRRNYFRFYLTLLKVKHILLFTFFISMDYNLKIVKIDLFIFNLLFSLTANALFFNDSTMHKIYTDQGKFNLEYQIPQIVYSTLIVCGINILINYLALTENDIISLKSIQSPLIIKIKKRKIIYKVFIYFIISFLFLLFFSFYLSCFCFIYENTKFHLFKDTVISFGLDLIYPLFLCLIPGIFRRCALKKTGKNCLYKFSQIIQKFI